MPEPIKLACPHCGSNERLFSTEATTIDFSIVVREIGPGHRMYEYTGEETITNDEGTQWGDLIYCRECTQETTLDGLVTVRFFAHANDTPEKTMDVDEDSDRGADVRFQAVCRAFGGGWSCDWASRWVHADEYDDGESSHPVEGARLDPAQRAYELAAQLGRDHLAAEGVTGTGAEPETQPT